MSVNYHFNPETGAVNVCNAQIKCRLRNDDGSKVAHGKDKDEILQQGNKKLQEIYTMKAFNKNQTVELDMSSPEIDDVFEQASVYKKQGKIEEREANSGEKIVKIAKNPTGSKIEIVAPWGEKQYGDSDCYIAQSLEDKNDRYIIGNKEFNETYGDFNRPFVAPVDVNLPRTTLTATLQTAKGKGYLKLDIPSEKLNKHIEAWKNYLGTKLSNEMMKNKAERDGRENKYHVTAVSPQETRKLKKMGVNIDYKNFSLSFTGIGSAKDGDKEAWFVTAESKEIDDYRASLNLPKHDLHVTLGFTVSDIHDQPKDESSWKII